MSGVYEKIATGCVEAVSVCKAPLMSRFRGFWLIFDAKTDNDNEKARTSSITTKARNTFFRFPSPFACYILGAVSL
jgi:hypothetical protein